MHRDAESIRSLLHQLRALLSRLPDADELGDADAAKLREAAGLLRRVVERARDAPTSDQ